MDELEISGKRYISTRRAAKEHKYHSDYIGQLIRARKVEGQKVGRSWYVVADSLTEYLGKEPQPQKIVAPVVSIAPTKHPLEKSQQHSPAYTMQQPVVEQMDAPTAEVEQPDADSIVEQITGDEEERHITLKIEKQFEEKQQPISTRSTRGTLRYVADDGPLYPRIERHITQRPAQVESYEPLVYAEHKPAPILERPHTNTKIRTIVKQAGLVLTLGAITLGAVAILSAYIVSTTTVQGQSATVSYTFWGL